MHISKTERTGARPWSKFRDDAKEPLADQCSWESTLPNVESIKYGMQSRCRYKLNLMRKLFIADIPKAVRSMSDAFEDDVGAKYIFETPVCISSATSLDPY